MSGMDHVLRRTQTVAAPRERVFAFFERAENLEAITPAFLRFRIVTRGPIEMKLGAIIDYRLRLRGVPIRWRTRIAEYDPPRRFVDEQIHGPYRRWVHEHRFEPGPDNSTIMHDLVHYQLPRVPMQGLIQRWLVAPDLARIFDFRAAEIDRVFAASPSPLP